MATITWTAKNNSSFLNGQREANTVRGAVTAARHYLENELMGEGKITIFENGQPIRQDEKSMFTSYKWETKNCD